MTCVAIRVLLVAALICGASAQVSTYGPCICKCAIGSATAAGSVAGCVDNQNPQVPQDCSSSCSQFQSFCLQQSGASAYGLAASASATDVTCVGGSSSAFPYSVTIWPFNATAPSSCTSRSSSDPSAFVQPAAAGSLPFTLGACSSLSIASTVRGVRLLGVSLSKNFIAFIYADNNCSPQSFLLSFGGQARGDCPNGQVAPSSTVVSVSGASVSFGAKVPGAVSNTNIACTCKCASPNSLEGPILGCTDVPASQCGGAYCAATYGGSACLAPNYFLATPPPDPIASQGVPCAGVQGYLLSARTYRYGTFCPNPSSSFQIGQTTSWRANDCVSSFNSGYSQRFLGCSSSNYYIFQTFVGYGCQPSRFISLTGGHAGCTYNTYPFGYTTTYTCSSPAQQLAAGIIAAIVIGAILIVVAIAFLFRFIRRRQTAILSYTAY